MMQMRKYLVTIHEDGHITAIEYEEPHGFVYRDSEAAVERGAYNHALRDVKTILEAEKARCDSNRCNKRYDQAQAARWAARSVECEVLEIAIEELFRK